jgi:hypothetical protein
MNALALPYWGQLPRSWATGTTTTNADLAVRDYELEQGREQFEELVFLIDAHEESFCSKARGVLYRLSGLPLRSRAFIVESPTGISVPEFVSETFTNQEVDPSVWRGVFAVQATRRTLFSQTIDLPTGKLRKLKPSIVIGRRTMQGEDA